MQNLSKSGAELLAQFYNNHLERNSRFIFTAQLMQESQYAFAAWEVNKVVK